MISRYGAIGMSTVSAEFFIENSTKIHNQIFHDIQKKFKVDDSIHSFQELVTLRRNELLQVYPDLNNGNLAAIFESSQSIHYIQLHAIKSINSYWHQLEKIAIELFGSLLACWGYYERFLILDKYQALPFSLFDNLSKDEFEYESEIVENIENDSRYFYTLYSNNPLLLSDANMLMVLSVLVLDQKWYEILFSLNSSKRDRHFILYYKDELNRSVVVASALIQSWEKREQWLSFDSFFQGDSWISCLNHKSRESLYKLGIFNEIILDSSSQLWAKYSLKQNIKSPSNVCEILRFTVSGPKFLRLFLLYFAQKELINKLIELQFLVSFIITDQPLFINFFKSINHPCYIVDSYKSINNSKRYTFKGFLIHKNTGDRLVRCSFKEFKKAALKYSRKNIIFN